MEMYRMISGVDFYAKNDMLVSLKGRNDPCIRVTLNFRFIVTNRNSGEEAMLFPSTDGVDVITAKFPPPPGVNPEEYPDGFFLADFFTFMLDDKQGYLALPKQDLIDANEDDITIEPVSGIMCYAWKGKPTAVYSETVPFARAVHILREYYDHWREPVHGQYDLEFVKDI